MRNPSSACGHSAPHRSLQHELERRAELQRLLPLWPHELADVSLMGRRRIVRFLARALREERRRSRAGHWAYDVARHAALARHHRLERDILERLEKTARQEDNNPAQR